MIKIKKEAGLITPKDIKPSSKEFEVIGAFNPATIRLPNGKIILYVRILEKLIKTEDEKYCYSPRLVGKNRFKIKLDRFNKKLISQKSDLDFVFKDETKRLTFISHLRKVILDKTGFSILSIDRKPSFYGLSWDGELGVEDARITKINNLYIMTYVTLSREENVSTSYAISNDCLKWYRRGLIFSEQNKDVVLFPEMINKMYVAFNRPEGVFEFTLPHIWISYSPNLEFWGEGKPIILSKKGEWDYGRTGAGPPPIKTEKGWLLLYHTVKEHEKEKKSFIDYIKKFFISGPEKIPYYSVGAALFDLKNPRKLIAKSKSSIINPVKKYEKGTFEKKKVVFPTGLVQDENGNLLIYSGGGDTVTSVKKVSLYDVMKSLKPIK